MRPLYKGQVGDWLYNEASLQGTSWGLADGCYTMRPLYKEQVGDWLDDKLVTTCPLFRGCHMAQGSKNEEAKLFYISSHDHMHMEEGAWLSLPTYVQCFALPDMM